MNNTEKLNEVTRELELLPELFLAKKKVVIEETTVKQLESFRFMLSEVPISTNETWKTMASIKTEIYKQLRNAKKREKRARENLKKLGELF